MEIEIDPINSEVAQALVNLTGNNSSPGFMAGIKAAAVDSPKSDFDEKKIDEMLKSNTEQLEYPDIAAEFDEDFLEFERLENYYMTGEKDEKHQIEGFGFSSIPSEEKFICNTDFEKEVNLNSLNSKNSSQNEYPPINAEILTSSVYRNLPFCSLLGRPNGPTS
ncbi:hypothetical protein AYI69_g9605 [Smittium culicis]|uniref:Uncharacterized protein n=1 Tax=Smittium culicis TaxID=133412 RepID=A0A1R1XBN1_9FUNG|nr:hypothetical protein AYI69_g9605 [Smittium culicis]